MNNFRKLMVWQKTVELVTLVYRIANGFLKAERYGITSQIERISVSIGSNIAESAEENLIKNFGTF